MTSRRSLLLIVISLAIATSTAFADDPPARVARLNYMSGDVSIQPGGVNDWVQGNINRPLTSSDRVWADKDARAELQLGGAALRLDNSTSLTLVNVSDNNVQLQLDQGTASLHVVELFNGEIYEVDTPNVSFIVRKSGDYRFDVDNAGDTTAVTVFRGEGDVTGEGPAVRVKKEQRFTFSGGKSLRYSVNNNPGLDGFDQWALARAEREDRAVSARYVSRYAVGYPDLDEYGSWETVATYGPVWYPRGIAVGWAPYRYGHWVYVSPWGWTWVDDAPWGFAPFHYGRWVYYRSRWGWCPGPYGVRPIYAPALVGWIGGPRFGVSLAFGVGGGVGWFPLGWGEPFIPYYGHSRGYFENVNIRNTRITNITYVTNNYYGDHHGRDWNYAYRGTPNAVTAVSNENFRNSRPTREAFVRVDEHELREARFERNVAVRPTTNSVLGEHAGEHHAVPPSTWSRPSRPERTSVADAETPRPDRITRRDPAGHDAIANDGVNNRIRENGPNRNVPRPPDRGNPTATAENERPHGIPNPDRGNPATTNNAAPTATRVPRPPDREDRPQNYGRPSRDVTTTAQPAAHPTPAAEAPARSYTPDRETRSVPRPQEGQVVRERHQDSVNRDQNQQAPRVREERNNPQQPAVTHDMRPQAPPVREEHNAPRAETARPSEPAHAAPASKPAPERAPREERKVEKNASPQGAVNYPRPYGTVRSASYSSPVNNYPRTTSDYAPRSYSRPTYSNSYNTSATSPSSHPYSYSQPTRSYSQPRREMSYVQPSRASSYSAPSHSSSYSAPSRSSAHYSQPSSSHSSYSHSSSSGSSGRGGGSSSSHHGR